MLDLISILLEIHESKSTSEDEKDILLEFAYNEYANDFISEFEDDVYRYLLESEDDPSDIKLDLFESGIMGMLSDDTYSTISTILTEAEEDLDKDKTSKMHRMKARIRAVHTADETDMKSRDKDKRVAAVNKATEERPNGKFKKKKDGTYADPRKTENAIKKYKAQDKEYTDQHGRQTHAYNKWYNEQMISRKATPADIKMLEYMRKQAAKGDEESLKKYKQVFNMFCAKYNLDPDSNLHLRYKKDPDKKIDRIMTTEVKNGHKFTATDTGADKEQEGKDGKDSKGKPKENLKEHAIPSGYMLIHNSTNGDIKELNPTINRSHTGLGAEEFRREGRVYFRLVNKEDFLKKYKTFTDKSGYGRHYYTPVTNISHFYIDNENGRQSNIMKDKGLNGFSLSKVPAVFVITEKPIKVRKLSHLKELIHNESNKK